MSADSDVRNASQQFYSALNAMLNGNTQPLDAIWSHDPSVSAMHPIGGRQVGWDEVRGSWEGVAGLAGGGSVALADQLIRVSGDMAYEIGVEQGTFTLAGRSVGQISHRVTNIYRREPSGWKIVHHHTDISQAMVDILKQVQGT